MNDKKLFYFISRFILHCFVLKPLSFFFDSYKKTVNKKMVNKNTDNILGFGWG